MSLVIKNKVSAFVCSSIFLLLSSGFGQQAVNSCDAVCNAEKMIAVFYPELRTDANVHLTAEFPLSLNHNLISFVMVIRAPMSHNDALLASPADLANEKTLNKISPELLVANLSYFADGETLQHIAFSGEAAHSKTLESLIKEVDENANWPDSRITQLLRDSNARYPSAENKAELLKRLPWQAMQSFLGTIHVNSASLLLRNPGDVEEHLPSAMLEWIISFTAQYPGEAPRTFDLAAEPFEGKVLVIQTLKARTKK